jgi:hypothetical protein
VSEQEHAELWQSQPRLMPRGFGSSPAGKSRVRSSDLETTSQASTGVCRSREAGRKVALSGSFSTIFEHLFTRVHERIWNPDIRFSPRILPKANRRPPDSERAVLHSLRSLSIIIGQRISIRLQAGQLYCLMSRRP